jgi:hypothetical protein
MNFYGGNAIQGHLDEIIIFPWFQPLENGRGSNLE